MYIMFVFIFIPQTSVALRGPGGFVRGLDSLGGAKSVHGNWPLWSPAWSPDYFSLGRSPESCAPPTLPAWSPAWSPCPPWSPWSPWSPVARFWCHACPLSGPRLFQSEGQFVGRFLARDCCLPLLRRFVAPKLP